MREKGVFAYFTLYSVLVCREHRCAVYGLDERLKQYHSMLAAETRALLASYENFNVLPPA
jgi:hypothetical protein